VWIQVKLVVFERAVGNFKHKFQRERGVAQPHQQLLASESLGYHLA